MRKVKKGNFKVFGHLVFKRPNGMYYIELDRGKHATLGTKNEDVAKRISLKLIQEILDDKVESIAKTENPSIMEYLETYLDSRQEMDKDTLDLDRTAVKMFGLVVGSKKMRELKAADGVKFKNHYLNKNVSRATIHTYFRHLHGFFKYAIEDQALSFTRSPLPKNVKKPKRNPKVIKKKDRAMVLKYLRKNDYELWRIAQFDLYTGLRREEIHDAEWKDFTSIDDADLAGRLTVIGKGDKERYVPILKQAFFAMGKPGKGRIFKQWHVDTYTHYFKKHARACGVGHIHFHMLRHTAATQMLEDGIYPAVIQKILGHADISTTMIYANVFNETMENEIKKLSYKGE